MSSSLARAPLPKARGPGRTVLKLPTWWVIQSAISSLNEIGSGEEIRRRKWKTNTQPRDSLKANRSIILFMSLTSTIPTFRILVQHI